MVTPHLDRPGYKQSPAFGSMHGPSLSALLENPEALAPLP